MVSWNPHVKVTFLFVSLDIRNCKHTAQNFKQQFFVEFFMKKIVKNPTLWVKNQKIYVEYNFFQMWLKENQNNTNTFPHNLEKWISIQTKKYRILIKNSTNVCTNLRRKYVFSLENMYIPTPLYPKIFQLQIKLWWGAHFIIKLIDCRDHQFFKIVL